MALEAVCFDLDHTLLDPGAGEALRRTCEVLAQALPGWDATQILDANQTVWSSYFTEVADAWTLGHIETSLIGLEAWRRTLRACDCDDEALVALARETHERLQAEAYCLYEDVLECLECIAPDLPIALITNGASDLQRSKIRLLEIERHFKLIVVSGEHGLAKPDPAVFKIVLNQFGVKQPSNAWHIGDNLGADVGGAKAAGMTAVWLNRTGATPGPGDPRPDHEITSLSALSALLAAAR